MVRHDVAGTVRQEQIVQYIQHINPVHTYNQWGEELGGGLPLKKLLGPLPSWPPCSYTTVYKTHNPVTHVKNTSVRIQIIEKEGCIVGE